MSQGHSHGGCSPCNEPKPCRKRRRRCPPCPPEATASVIQLESELPFGPSVAAPCFPPGPEVNFFSTLAFDDPRFPNCAVLLTRVRFPAGYATPRHFFTRSTYAVMLSGSILLSIDGLPPTVIGPSDSFVIPPNIPNTLEALEASEFLVFGVGGSNSAVCV